MGAKNAGFRTELAIDKDRDLSASFRSNFSTSNFLPFDIAAIDKDFLRAHLPTGVDGVIGGPPCQGFSSIGRQALDDPRRNLVRDFFRIVSIARPSFFLMENVKGLSFSRHIDVLNKGLDQLNGRWKIIGPLILDAADFGAPTSRARLFVLGFDSEKMNVPSADQFLPSTTVAKTTVADAIKDISNARYYCEDATGFDYWRYSQMKNISVYAQRMRSMSGLFSGHNKTVHTDIVTRRFAKVLPGKIDAIGRHPRLSWSGVCPTLRAGTGSDRGSYQSVRPLHPKEDRVITAREAARLQGFPDDFLFHPTTWHSFRMIGNSVSPIIAEALLKIVIRNMSSAQQSKAFRRAG